MEAVNQPQQHQQKQQQPEWKPDPSTTKFFVQTDDRFEPRARAYLRSKYGAAAKAIVTEINAAQLSERHTIVVLYFDPDADVREPDGKHRPRFMGLKKDGKWDRKPEEPDVLESRPIECGKFYAEGADNDGAVRLKQLWDDSGPNERGKYIDGLLVTISKACHPARAHYREDTGIIQVRGA